MHSRYRLLVLISILVLCSMFVSSASAAQKGPLSPGEFREKFAEYMAWLDSNTPQNAHLAEKVQGLNDEEVQALYNSFEDPDGFIAITEQIMASTSQAQAASASRALAPQLAVPATTLFSPDYPKGSVYDAWVATLPGFGLLLDGDGDGTANDRCTYDGEAGIAIASGPLNVAAIAGDVACNSIVVILGEGTNLPACIVAGVLHGATLANDIVNNQCSYQDGSVNGAEIEAAYENSKLISGQVYSVANQIDVHDTDIKAILSANQTELKTILAANHTEVINTLAANQAQVLKVEIEKALADTNDNKRLSYFYLPAARGGLLEQVRQTVWDAMNANRAAGLPVGMAQSWFDKAEASFKRGDFKTAYDQYGKAYLETVK